MAFKQKLCLLLMLLLIVNANYVIIYYNANILIRLFLDEMCDSVKRARSITKFVFNGLLNKSSNWR